MNTGSERIDDVIDRVVCGYNNSPGSAPENIKRDCQKKKMNLQKLIQSDLAHAYENENSIITHFYECKKHSDAPIWALFEILTLGDFGYFLSCLTCEVREDISKRIGLNLSCDTNRQLVYKYIYALKDLRNAIAHNAVVFDARFRNISPTRAMKKNLEIGTGVQNINFETIDDYVTLVCYYLKILKAPKNEIEEFIRSFYDITEEYKTLVSSRVANLVVRPDLTSRISTLQKYTEE